MLVFADVLVRASVGAVVNVSFIAEAVVAGCCVVAAPETVENFGFY